VSFFLLVAVAAPVAGVLVGAAWPARATVVGRASALASAGSWVVVLVHGGTVSAGRLHGAPLPAAAGFGAAAIAAALPEDAAPRRVPLGLALAAIGLALAAGRSTTDGAALVAALGIAAVAAGVAARPAPGALLLAAAAVATGILGIVALRSAANSWALPVSGGAVPLHRGEGLLLLLAAVLFVAAGSLRPGAAVAILVPGGLLLAAGAAPLARGLQGLAGVAIPLAALAAAASLAARDGRPLLDRPVAALGLLAIAALVGPGATRPAGLLLAAAAGLTAAVGVPVTMALAFPGGVALAAALADRGGGAAFAEGALAGLTAVALAAAAVRDGVPARPSLWTAPAAVAGLWLLTAPGSWAWTGPAGLHAYDLGASRAVAGAALLLVALSVRSQLPAGWYARGSPPVTPGEDAVRH
jgi:hypothetical protein